MTNPWESDARYRKAVKIADHLWSLMDDELRENRGTASAVARMSPERRLAVTKAAGAHAETRGKTPPSDATWALVVERIDRMGLHHRMDALPRAAG